MAGDTLEQARSALQQRLKELRSETGQVEKALAALGDSLPTSRRPRAKGRRTARRSSDRRSPRSDQFIAALKKEPGARVSEVAKKLGISPQQGHGIAKRLRDRGLIKKQGKGYAVKS
jgi:septal ring factor EnvC (AmiA/AmiB activator)